MMEPRLLGNVLKKLIQSSELGDSLNHIEFLSRWDDIVSPPVNKHARPAGIKGKELMVEVDSSAWLNELSFLKGEIKKRINDSFGEEIIEEIRFYLKEDK